MSKIIKVRLQKAVSIFTTFTTVMWLSGVALLTPMAAKAVVLNEGDLVRGPDGIKVYIINAYGYKRHIYNPAVFGMYGHFTWNSIKSVDQATLDSYTISDIYRASGDTKVYQTAADGIKRWFDMTAEQFAASYNWNQVFIVNGAERDYYSTGSSITSGEAPVVGTAALTVSLASDTPATAILAENTARNQFTKVNLTAGSGADVEVTGLTIQRTGQADDAAFASVIMLDGADMTQIGLSQSLNSIHEANFTDKITVAKGTTKSIILAGNMAASLDNYTGQLASLTLKSITTSAAISGSLPLVGNQMTLNSNLSVGSATATIGSLDPGADATKNVGTKDYYFAGIKLTAGSVEDITVEQLKFNQSGSAASSDLENVKLIVDGEEFATSVSSDGKYYNAVVGSGIVIGKGLSKEFSIRGDIKGGSQRTIAMDIYKATDAVVKGNLYGYHLTVGGGSSGAASDGGFSSDNNPYFNSYDVTINKGTLRVDKSNASVASNIAEGSSQIIGALDFVVEGESIRISDMRIELDIEVADTTNTTAADITLITIYDKDGNAVLGPLDGVANNLYGDTDAGDGSVRYQTALVIPAGTNTYTVKGKIGTDFSNNDTVRVGMITPATRVATATGVTTGESITATPATATWANTQTVKAGALAVSVSTQPVAQDVVRGINGYIFAKFVFDGSNSGEDVRVTSMKVQHIVSAAAEGNKVTTLQLFDGDTILNTTAISPTDTTNTTQEDTYTFNNTLLIPKQSIKILTLKGNISSAATAATTHRFGIDATPAVNATGATTGTTVTPTYSASNGQLMTVRGNGAFAVALDAGTHTGKLAYGGATGVEMSRLRFNATSEAINLTDLVLQLGSASTSQDDLVKIYLYDTAGVKLSEQVATTTAQIPFVIPSGTFIIPKDGEKVMIVKADISSVGVGLAGTAGHIIALDYNGDQYYAVKGLGQSSGNTITADTMYDTAQTAVYLYKAIPKFEKVSLTNNVLTNGTQDVFKFKVTAQGGDIDLLKFTVRISTTTMNTEDFTLVDITESGEVTLYASSTAAGVYGDTSDPNGDGQILLAASPGTTLPASIATATPRTVSNSLPRTFVVRLTNSGVATGDSLSVQLQGDANYHGTGGILQTAANVDAWPTSDAMIWSDRSGTTTHGVTINEWTNGYLVTGLPSSNMPSEVLSK